MKPTLIVKVEFLPSLLQLRAGAWAALISCGTLGLLGGAMLPEAHAQDVSSATEAATETAGSVFKGVGRRYPSLHMGLDFMALSTPHYSANRAVFGSQYAFWGEYWPQDAFGVKGIYASQKYPDLSNANLSHATTTLAFLGKYRFDTGSDWHFTVGVGVGSSDRNPPTGTDLKSTSVLVTEMRTGLKASEFLWLEGGVLVLDGRSGSGSSAARVGSTNYGFGLNFGF